MVELKSEKCYLEQILSDLLELETIQVIQVIGQFSGMISNIDHLENSISKVHFKKYSNSVMALS